MAVPTPSPRPGKFAQLRDAYKAAKARAKHDVTWKAYAAYLERARVASILLSKLRRDLDGAE